MGNLGKFIEDGRNLSMLCDFYEFTMANGYFLNGMENKIAYFDMFSEIRRITAVFPLWRGCSKTIDYINDCVSTRRTTRFSKIRASFARVFKLSQKFRVHLRRVGDPECTPVSPASRF
jgi:nicotinate phosphoribosyltransferase